MDWEDLSERSDRFIHAKCTTEMLRLDALLIKQQEEITKLKESNTFKDGQIAHLKEALAQLEQRTGGALTAQNWTD